jgi:hypothetical protein
VSRITCGLGRAVAIFASLLAPGHDPATSLT